MFQYYNTRQGKEISKGFNATIHEYREPGKKGCLVKCMPAQDIEKLKQYLEEYCLGFNNKHPFVLNYKGLDIEEVNENGNKYMVYIKMKPMKQSLRKFIREFNQKKCDKQYVPLEKVIWIFYSLSSALAYLEEKDIVHSNIMHDSILFDDNGTTKLGGFAFSKYKTSLTGNKLYQSYLSPEKFLERLKSIEKNKDDIELDGLMKELLNERIDEKEKAFKSDIWCLGKLIIDICLLRDEVLNQENWEKISQKTYQDLEQVGSIYQDPNLKRILQRLLAIRSQKRPSFKQICEELKESYPNMGLIEMENRKEGEGREINSSEICVSEIAQEEEKIDIGNSFLPSENTSDIKRISEEQKTIQEDLQVIKQNMEKAIRNFKKSSQKSLEEIGLMIKEVTDYRIYHIEFSKENIEGFFNKTEALLKTFSTSFENLDLTYKEIKNNFEKYEFSQQISIEKSNEEIPKSAGFSRLGLNSFRHPQERSQTSIDMNFNYVNEG